MWKARKSPVLKQNQASKQKARFRVSTCNMISETETKKCENLWNIQKCFPAGRRLPAVIA